MATTEDINEDDIPVRLDIYVQAGEVLALMDAIACMTRAYEDELTRAHAAYDFGAETRKRAAHLAKVSSKLSNWARRTYPIKGVGVART